jgi:predicted RNA-binding protein with RPS1 domain
MQKDNTRELIDFDLLFSQGNSKFNQTIKLTSEDQRSGLKIFCKEPYAQELYDMYFSSNSKTSFVPSNKDFELGKICTVTAKKIDFDEKMIEVQDNASLSTIFVPFREFSSEPSLLVHNEVNHSFKVIVYKNDNGDFLGSEKRCAALSHREDLEDYLKTEKWFYVKVTNLVKGGYLALYKGTVKCFLPGSHAAANVIRDFNEYLNKEIPVMIENYDSTNDLFIVSYKKYIKQTLPQKVHELKIGEKYTGILTNKPYDFGMFVEFQNYFTGLLHKTEFENYEEVSKQYRSGDTIEFYVKDVILKKGEPRIILTDSYDKIGQEQLQWQDLKNKIEGQTLTYSLDKSNFSITITMPDGENTFNSDVNHLKGRTKISDSGQIKVHKVDAIRKQLRYDFIQ